MKRMLLAAGLLVGALAWVGLLGSFLPGASTESKPAADGSVATIKLVDKSRFEVSKTGEVTLRLDILSPDAAPVRGLSQEKVKVFEEGQPAKIREFNGPGTQILNVVLVIDISGSMSGQKLAGAKNAALAAVDELQIDRDRIGVIVFSDNYLTLQPLVRLTNNVRDEVRRRIDRLNAGGGTQIGEPTQAGLELYRDATPDGAKLLLVMTDGLDEELVKPFMRRPFESTRLLDDLESDSDKLGVPISTIAFGKGSNEAEFGSEDSLAEQPLKYIAEHCNGQYYHAPTSEELASIFRSQVQELKDGFLIKYDSPYPEPDGLPRKVEVKIASPSGQLLATGGYQIGRILSGSGGRTPLTRGTDLAEDEVAGGAGSGLKLLLALVLGSVLVGGLLAPTFVPALAMLLGSPLASNRDNGDAFDLDESDMLSPHAANTSAAPPPPLPGSSPVAGSAGATLNEAWSPPSSPSPADPSGDDHLQTMPLADSAAGPLPSAPAMPAAPGSQQDRSSAAAPPPPPPVRRTPGSPPAASSNPSSNPSSPARPATTSGPVSTPPPPPPTRNLPAAKPNPPANTGTPAPPGRPANGGSSGTPASGMPAPPPPPPIKRKS